MPQVTTQDMQEMKEAIAMLTKEVRNGFAEVKGDIVEIKGDLRNIETRLITVEKAADLVYQKLPDLAEKVGEMKNWKQFAFIVLAALVSGTVTWFARK